jgi:uncharacterized protein
MKPTIYLIKCLYRRIGLKKKLVDILACPVDKAPLELSIEKETGEEVEKGGLKCTRCGHLYPIEEGIPNLLPPVK